MGSAPYSAPPRPVVGELRERMSRIGVRTMLWVGTPLMAVIQLGEWAAGRYDALLAGQAVFHVAACVGVLWSRRLDFRALVTIGWVFVHAQVILLHYGPTFTVGLLFLAAIMTGQAFFGWRAVAAILSLVAASFVLSGGAVFALAGAPFFDPGVADPTRLGTWVRLTLSGLPILAIIAVLLGHVFSSLSRSAQESAAALERERHERAEKERSDEARRQTERALAESQRQELIGRLAAGASHDLNNVLTAILCTVELAELKLKDGDPEAIRNELGHITDSARRASSMGRQLLSFSRQQHTQPREVDVDELLSGLGKLLRRLLPSPIRLAVTTAPELPPVFADPAQLEQLVMNLVVNARDAMPEGGKVSVSAERARGPEGRPGIRLAVADTGLGISEDVQAKMFDPFFTTKAGVGGTGLGLATVRTIVEELSGTTAVDTRMGEGTTFRIWLPECARGDRESTLAARDPRVRSGGGEERILVADDDSEVRRLAQRILSGAGYRVQTAQDGDEVLERVAENEYDLVVLDAVMPGPTGSRLVTLLEQRRPDLRLLFSTGYDPGVFGPGFFSDGTRRLLAKPYRSADLVSAVREALDLARPVAAGRS